jgi:hypothetical protein
LLLNNASSGIPAAFYRRIIGICLAGPLAMYRFSLLSFDQVPQAYPELPSLNDPTAVTDRLHRL